MAISTPFKQYMLNTCILTVCSKISIRTHTCEWVIDGMTCCTIETRRHWQADIWKYWGQYWFIKKKDDCFCFLKHLFTPKYTKDNHLSALTVILSYSGDVIFYAIRPVVSGAVLTWFIRYIFNRSLQFLNRVMIIKSKVFVPQE